MHLLYKDAVINYHAILSSFIKPAVIKTRNINQIDSADVRCHVKDEQVYVEGAATAQFTHESVPDVALVLRSACKKV